MSAVSSGMKDAGYVYINIDDTWEGGREQVVTVPSHGVALWRVRH